MGVGGRVRHEPPSSCRPLRLWAAPSPRVAPHGSPSGDAPQLHRTIASVPRRAAAGHRPVDGRGGGRGPPPIGGGPATRPAAIIRRSPARTRTTPASCPRPSAGSARSRGSSSTRAQDRSRQAGRRQRAGCHAAVWPAWPAGAPGSACVTRPRGSKPRGDRRAHAAPTGAVGACQAMAAARQAGPRSHWSGRPQVGVVEERVRPTSDCQADRVIPILSTTPSHPDNPQREGPP
jgi:hypothetical protein